MSTVAEMAQPAPYAGLRREILTPAPKSDIFPTVTLPLKDVRILAVEQFGAGPWATLQLADMGAEVIKIEDPGGGGDSGRYVPPYQYDEDSLFFETLNRNKRSVSLDLKNPAARVAFERLVAGSDAVFSNLRGDQPEKLGLTFESLRHINPRIVCCSLSGFGMTGPRADEGAYDNVIQGLAGWMSLTGEPDTPPLKTGLSLVDISAGYVAAIALLGGLWRARRDGMGCDCDISLFETALAELLYVSTWVATERYAPMRRSNSAHPSIVPFQNFETSDGWIVIACAKQKFWLRLCKALGLPQLAEECDFLDFASRDANRGRLLAILEDTLRAYSTSHWLERLKAAQVPAAPINDVAAALDDIQAKARGSVVSIYHPRFGEVRQVASPLRFSSTSPPLERGPFRGEHTRRLLIKLAGYSEAELAQLERAGAFGDVAVATRDKAAVSE